MATAIASGLLKTLVPINIEEDEDEMENELLRFDIEVKNKKEEKDEAEVNEKKEEPLTEIKNHSETVFNLIDL